MGRVQQIFAGVGVDRDALGRQRLHVGREIPPRGQQDADILVLHRAGGAALPHRFAGSHQFGNAFRDKRRVRLGGVVGQKLRFHAAGVLPRCTADQPLPVAVGCIAQRGGHELLKEEIDAPHHLRRTAEVGVQRQQSVPAGDSLRRAGAGGFAFQQRPCVQLFPEDAGVSLTETVDALLQVAHEEEVIPRRAGQTAVERILQRICILIFVHHDGGVILPDALTQGGGGCRPGCGGAGGPDARNR